MGKVSAFKYYFAMTNTVNDCGLWLVAKSWSNTGWWWCLGCWSICFRACLAAWYWPTWRWYYWKKWRHFDSWKPLTQVILQVTIPKMNRIVSHLGYSKLRSPCCFRFRNWRRCTCRSPCSVVLTQLRPLAITAWCLVLIGDHHSHCDSMWFPSWWGLTHPTRDFFQPTLKFLVI